MFFAKRLAIACALMLVALLPASASAAIIADLTVLETDLGGGGYLYDYTLTNLADPVLDAGFNIFNIEVTLAPGTNVVGATALPLTWDTISGVGFWHSHSTDPNFDIVPGFSLGWSLVVDQQQLGPVTFTVLFANPADPGTPIPFPAAPEPAALLMIGTSLVVAAIRQRRQRRQ
jgi:hypothetical protein